MENEVKKYSFKNHSDLNAKIYCANCNLYICKEWEIYHSIFGKEHQIYSISKELNEIFTGYCRDENHLNKFEYFCKTHNILCCAKCITKIKNEKNGKHTDCTICNIEDIMNEKKSMLKDKIKNLEELSKTIQTSIDNIKTMLDNLNEKKEEIKLKIQKTFTKIRNELNNREDELFSIIDNLYENTFFKEDSIRQFEKLPQKIHSSLEKYKNLDINMKENKFLSLINDYINIENESKEVELIYENMTNFKKSNSINSLNFEFNSKEEEILRSINTFGEINKYINKEFLKSSILRNDLKNQKLIVNWIYEAINKDKIKFELIFKMTQNGTNSDKFHNLCNDQGPTLTLIKTTENKIFGGFTPLDWKNEGGFIVDKSMITFVFSLNLCKKYNLKDKENQAIKCKFENGPSFGNGDIIIYQNMKEGKAYANNKSVFFSDGNLELIEYMGEVKGFKGFTVAEIEVYKIIYN